MSPPLLILIAAQTLFTLGDLWARHRMARDGFSPRVFLTGWFAVYFLLRNVATLGQLYAFTAYELGKMIALSGAISVITANALGFLVLQEVMSVRAYIGVALAIGALLALTG